MKKLLFYQQNFFQVKYTVQCPFIILLMWYIQYFFIILFFYFRNDHNRAKIPNNLGLQGKKGKFFFSKRRSKNHVKKIPLL